MPTLTRTWTSSQNNAPSDQTTQEKQGQSILLALKNAFVSAGWTVTQSCNSSAVNSSGDNWSSISDIVNASSGAHSWIVLKSPANYPSTGNYYYFAIDYAASNDYKCDFHTATADWTGGTTSSIGSNSTNFTWNDEDILPTSFSDVKYHQSYSNSGDMAFVVSQNSNSNPGFGLYVNKLSNAPSADNYPILTFISGHSSSFSQSSRASYAWDKSSFLESSSYTKMHWIDGTNGGSTTQELFNSDFFTYAGGQGSGSDIDGNLPAGPLAVVGITSSKQGFRGVVTDIFVCNRGSIYTPLQSVSPQSGTITLWNTDHLWIPGSSVPNYGT